MARPPISHYPHDADRRILSAPSHHDTVTLIFHVEQWPCPPVLLTAHSLILVFFLFFRVFSCLCVSSDCSSVHSLRFPVLFHFAYLLRSVLQPFPHQLFRPYFRFHRMHLHCHPDLFPVPLRNIVCERPDDISVFIPYNKAFVFSCCPHCSINRLVFFAFFFF